ncbi:MAG: polysaccharide deacetylase family protein [Candidatus Bathyarchaeia archaeon]
MDPVLSLPYGLIITYCSMLYHTLAYLPRNKQSSGCGTLITSIDVDVGNRAIGRINNGRNDRNVHDRLNEYTIGLGEELSVPVLVDMFEELEMPVTFALRGQLIDNDPSLIRRLLKSRVRFDIGAHGYYHKEFRKLSRREAELELKMISASMKVFDLAPRSFVFPRNSVAHLDLIRKYGYLCYRGKGGFVRDGTYIRKVEGLYDVHPSLFITRHAILNCLKRILDECIQGGRPLHVWFHPKDLGLNSSSIQYANRTVFRPFFEYADKKRQEGALKVETMASMATKAENSEKLCSTSEHVDPSKSSSQLNRVRT